MGSIHDDGGSDNTSIYAGAGAGAVVLVLVVIVIVVLLHRQGQIAAKRSHPVATVAMSRINNEVDHLKMVNLSGEPIYDTIGDPENHYNQPRMTSNVNNPNYGKSSDFPVSTIEVKYGNNDIEQSATEHREEYMCMGGNTEKETCDSPKSAYMCMGGNTGKMTSDAPKSGAV